MVLFRYLVAMVGASLRVSSLALLFAAPAAPVSAHEVLPAIADMQEREGELTFAVRLNLEGVVAGIDLSQTADTNSAPQAASYDELRGLDPGALEARFRDFWPAMAAAIHITAGSSRLEPVLAGVEIPPTGSPETVRTSTIYFKARLPADAEAVTVGWDAAFGTLVLRQMGVDAPYDGYLEAGATTPPIALTGGGQAGRLATFLGYIPVGFDHIVPKGLDHILFVLGLFFLSTRWRPLLGQVSAFTIAHTITLALAALGYVRLPPAVVEPLIAASIVFVAVENMLSDGLSRWRPVVVFGFGLLHGLGFASVLGQFGLPEDAFVPALIGFNLGVEFGQLAVIAAAYAAVGYWFGGRGWYRRVISVPASAAIAVVGAWWAFERVFL